jgi:hypothetical protein
MTGDQEGETGGCWLHPHVRVQVSVIQGRGLFATEPLTAGTTIASLAGQLVSGDELDRLIDPAATHLGFCAYEKDGSRPASTRIMVTCTSSWKHSD